MRFILADGGSRNDLRDLPPGHCEQICAKLRPMLHLSSRHVRLELMSQQENSATAITLQFADVAQFVREAKRRRGQIEEQQPPPSLYRIAFGLDPVVLGNLEFRILMLLASKPYWPFSPHSIVAAITTEREPVLEETIDQHIASLREQMGFFRDYVQTVPYLGYRFKP
jgi:DNA-binding response OmpR family regulator